MIPAKSLLTATLAGLALSAAASAALVSINFTGNAGANGSLSASDVAGALPAANWNNATSGSALVDSTGAASALTVTYNIGGWSNQFVGATTANERLMKGYLDINQNTATLTLNNLSASQTYQIYLYSDGENTSAAVPAVRTGTFTIGGVATGITDLAGAQFSGAFTPVTAGTTGAGNYTVFTVTGSTSYTISAQGTAADAIDNVFRAPINGLQVVSVPEAGTASLLGACGLLALTRRRRGNSAS
ncbi:MAG: hypothetical protein JWO82_2733 [Akkermansiaceae bacterium]|nr:hypothetical protein [Akkermansiaceae bacterium]